MRNALTLFSSTDCVLCHRVRLVLAAKGVTYDLIPVDPQNPPEDLVDLNPYHSVPTLVERDLVLYAASVVSEYLDERYPHPPLMPVDPLSRARLRLAMLRLEHDWVPQVQAIQLGNKSRPKPVASASRNCSPPQVPLFKASKFFLNPEMSLADCAMAPIIWRLPALGVPLPKDGKVIEDYGNRIFRNPGLPGASPTPSASCATCRPESWSAECTRRGPELRAFSRSGGLARRYTSRMTEDSTIMTSHRPYLLRALYEWIADNGMTPHLLVDATVRTCRCPVHAVKDGRHRPERRRALRSPTAR
jgi:RNA polymerase-associated protein